jgi:transglutaminase-like putative cysteine protease
VVETGDAGMPDDGVSWADLRSPEVIDRYAEYLEPTAYVPRDRELAAVARGLRKGRRPVDPTNDIEVGPRHIWVAIGRDYGDVSPVKGTYSGGAATAIEVSVEVTRLA